MGFPFGNPIAIFTFIFTFVRLRSAYTFGSCIPHRFLPTATLIRSICIYVPTGCSGTAFLANKLHLRHHTHLVWNCSRLPCGYNARDTFAFSAPPLSLLYNSAVESGFSLRFLHNISANLAPLSRIFSNRQLPIQKSCSVIPFVRP